ncbi:MAG: ketol-acid reductoisomerase [Rhizobiales bacterium]|nr:ketol-acid reductoisomerase [Hyphomicrobiales bacterium]
MAQWYFDEDGDLSLLEGRTVCIFGYGNQGRAQALNMRDSGIEVIVGSRSDASAEQCREDGFAVHPLAEAAARADVLFLLLPDEVMPEIYRAEIAPHLKPGVVLVFASGYNIFFKHITPPADADVVLVAPRMIGKGVRDTFVSGVGFPSLIGVEQDASGKALARTIALSKAIGSTRMGVVMSSFREETIIDLFAEQWGFLYAVRRAYEVLTEAGCGSEAVLLELYASGEGIETARAYRDIGLFHQITLHSRTSQYGQEVTARLAPDEDEAEKDKLRKIVREIADGTFARAWAAEQAGGAKTLEAAHRAALAHPMVVEEQKLYKLLGRV